MVNIVCTNGAQINTDTTLILVGGIGTRGIVAVDFYDLGHNMVQLQSAGQGGGGPLLGSVSCYFLPWAENGVTNLGLADGADYFFTSNLTGCALGIGATDTEIVVVHCNKTASEGSDKCPRHRATGSESGSDDEGGNDDEDDCLDCARHASAVKNARNLAEYLTTHKTLVGLHAANSVIKTPGTLNAGNSTAGVFGIRNAGHWNFYVQRRNIAGLTTELLAAF